MWSPADKSAFPSTVDKIQAKKEIQRVKSEIKETEVQLAQVLLRLDMLKKELAERKAWLAPIRKLSHDELTIIFNMCAEMDWIAPMRLAFVSRTWRRAILANPRAWSYIKPSSTRTLKLVPLYLERSGQCTLRVVLDESTRLEYYIAINQMAPRIRCLTIPNFSPQLLRTNFPFLNRLCLTCEDDVRTILDLSGTRMPLLRRIDVYFPLSMVPLWLDDPLNLPLPLPQTLRLGSYRGINDIYVVSIYGQSLTSLDYTIRRDTSFSQPHVISLPQLQTLAFNDLGKEKSPITMITPRLRVLVTSTNYDSVLFPLEMDLGRLTHVRTDGKQVPPLSELSGLKVLHIYPDSPRYVEILKPLVDEPSACRELEIVELRLKALSDADSLEFQKLFLRINGPRESHIEHFIHNRFTLGTKCYLKVGITLVRAIRITAKAKIDGHSHTKFLVARFGWGQLS